MVTLFRARLIILTTKRTEALNQHFTKLQSTGYLPVTAMEARHPEKQQIFPANVIRGGRRAGSVLVRDREMATGWNVPVGEGYVRCCNEGWRDSISLPMANFTETVSEGYA